MGRLEVFRQREQQILLQAEALLDTYGEQGLTIDALAEVMDLSKGTLYKHFESKDALLIQLLIRHETLLLSLLDTDQEFSKTLHAYVTNYLDHYERTLYFQQLEESLAAAHVDLRKEFEQLYSIRKKRLILEFQVTKKYLRDVNSDLSTRDYMAAIWSMMHGVAALLNSSYYQRFLGDREEWKKRIIKQLLVLPINTSLPQ